MHSHTNALAPAKEEGGMEGGKEWENGQHHKSVDTVSGGSIVV